jgi:type IV secretory pathway VirB4 component
LGRCAFPCERPGHVSTTAHFQAVYPAVAEGGLGAHGVYIGRDMHGGSFVYDPWVLYARGILNDANTLVIGRPDFGKSSLSKTWLYRSRVFGRRGEIIDLKGEYEPLVHALGGRILRLTPGGRMRLNPLTRIGRREMREGLLEAITRAVLDRALSQAEAVGLAAALDAADAHRDGAEVCIPDVIEQLREPKRELADRLGTSEQDARLELREAALALQRLCQGPLRGMFDGPTTAGEDVFEAPVISLDLSEVADGVATVNLPIAIAMVCAVAFLDAKRVERWETVSRRGGELEKTIRVNDEAWRALPIAGLGDYYQAAFKLSRKTGVQHWLVLHRISDLRAAGDDGTRQQRLAEGLLADASTTIIYRQHAQELPLTTDALGLSETERKLIATLEQGVALWRVGGRSFEVRHVLSDMEWDLIDTDQAMGRRAKRGELVA